MMTITRHTVGDIKIPLRGPGGGQWVLQDEDDRVAPQEHLGDEPVLVHRLSLLLPWKFAMLIVHKMSYHWILTFSSLGEFSPHFLDSLQHHVAVPVKCLHPPQQLLVIPIDYLVQSKNYFFGSANTNLQLMSTWVLFFTESVRTLQSQDEAGTSCPMNPWYLAWSKQPLNEFVGVK